MPDEFKMINATKETACRTAEAEAIRAKTGDTDPLTYDFENDKGFADAIAAIPSGGSLPSVISKIDDGSFKYVSDVGTVSHRISHNLGVEPKVVIIWTDDVVTNNVHLKAASLINIPYTSSNEGVRTAIRGGGTVISASYTTADKADYISSTDFCINYNNILFARNVTYKWVAWV